MAKRPFLLRRVRRYVLEHVGGVSLVVFPDVLNPVVFRSGDYFARVIERIPLAEPPAGLAPARALDMGTGTGVAALFAARRGYQVVAVDLNPEAVRCARINALMNRAEDRIEVRQGDLFAPVAGEQFDLVLFNPPFFRGQPRDLFDMAWRSVDVPERFASGLLTMLRPGGKALILLSTDGDASGLLAALEHSALTVQVAAQRHFGSEIMTVYCAQRP
jgi:HemK-related putative methylase